MGAASRALVVRQVVQAYTCVLIWMSISIAVIIFNKWLLAFSGFPFPITLTLWHMAFCSTVAFVVVRVLRLVPSANISARKYWCRVMPIGLLYAGSLWLSNSSYLYLSVSFIQMTKSLMPGLVFGCGCLVGTETFRAATALNMGLIAAGVVVCGLGETNLSLVGLATQLSSLGFEAMRLTLVQVLIASQGISLNPVQSLYYVSPACLLALLLPFVVVERPRIVAAVAAGKLTFRPGVLLANGVAAFVLNLAVFLLIGKTSALTMNIAGVIKDWMLIFCSYYLFHAPLTGLTLAGYAVCCSGVVWYNHAKLKLLRAKAAAAGGAGLQPQAAAASGKAPPGGRDGRDVEAPALQLQSRTRDELLGEIRRLQGEMDVLLERRGAKLGAAALLAGGGGGGGGSGGSPGGGSPGIGAGWLQPHGRGDSDSSRGDDSQGSHSNPHHED